MSLGNIFKRSSHEPRPKPAPTTVGKRASMYATQRLTEWGRDNIQWYLSKITSGEARYKKVEQLSGVPWEVIAVIHCLECSGDFGKHLHNGDPIEAKTVRVPKGRPKANDWTWESSAVDALQYDKLQKVDWNDTEKGLYAIEAYNGLGYEKYHPEVNSPYLWSGSHYYSKGKYVADGKWSATAVSKQMGAAVLLKSIGWHVA